MANNPFKHVYINIVSYVIMFTMPWILYSILNHYYDFTFEHAKSGVTLIRKWDQADAASYQEIALRDYTYYREKSSIVAFFPLYPKLCAFVIKLTRCDPVVCLIVVANLFLLFTYGILFVVTLPNGSAVQQWTLAVFCLFPSTFFFHLGYAESMFCFFAALALLGMQRKWPLWVLALIAGAATGTRPVGIAVSAAVWWYALITLHRTPSPLTPLPRGERGTKALTPKPLSLQGRGEPEPSPWGGEGNQQAITPRHLFNFPLARSSFLLWVALLHGLLVVCV
jgi:hypothetical protein